MNLVPLQDIATAILGVSFTTVFAALVFTAVRVMLRHQLGIWASRSTIQRKVGIGLSGATLYDYRFIIHNLEPVPLDLPLSIILEEKSFPLIIPRSLFPAPSAPLTNSREGVVNESNVSSMPRPSREFRESIRVYSGVCKPTFVRSEVSNVESVLSKSPVRKSSIRFRSMRPHDTWTIRLLSAAGSVTLRIIPDGTPSSRINPLRPWLAITTWASAISIFQDGVVGRSGKLQPRWMFAFWTTALSPAFYAFTRWFLLRDVIDGPDMKPASSLLDLLALIFLIVMGALWFMWIRRPIYPAIQGYRGFRTPESNSIEFEE